MPNVSTRDFIEALRSGDYLRFLQWPFFLIDQYHADNAEAETLINLTVFSWLKAGFSDEDIKHITIINAIMNDKNCPVKGVEAYVGVYLIGAALQCMVLKKFNITDFYCTKDNLDKHAIINFMNREHVLLNPATNSEQLLKEQICLNDLAKKKLPDIKRSLQKMSVICTIKDAVDGYISLLDWENRENPDQLKAMRIGIARALREALKEYTQESAQLTEVIGQYFNQLSAIGLQIWEEDYLSSIVPKPWNERLIIWSTECALTFFNHVIAEKKKGCACEEKEPGAPEKQSFNG